MLKCVEIKKINRLTLLHSGKQFVTAVVLFILTLPVDGQKARVQDLRAVGLKCEVPARAVDSDQGFGSRHGRRNHLGCDSSLPDQIIDFELVVGQMSAN